MTDPHIARREEVMAWLDGELAGDRADAAREHLATCAECTAVAEAWRRTSAALGAWQVEASPDRLAARVIDAAANAGTPRRSSAWSFLFLNTITKWSLVAASIAAVAITTVVVSRIRESRELAQAGYQTSVREAANTPAPNEPAPSAPAPAAGTGTASDRESRSASVRKGEGVAPSRRTDAKQVGERSRAGAADAAQLQAAASAVASPPPPPSALPVAPPVSAPAPAAAPQMTMAAPPPPAAPAAKPAAETKVTQPTTQGRGGRGGGGGRGAGFGGLGYVQPAFRSAAPEPPSIVRTAEIGIVVERVDAARAAIERIVKQRGGQIGSIDVSTEAVNRRGLNAVLRIPVANVEAALADLRQLGKVSRESQSSDDISVAVRDLGARLTNARQQEARLRELLQRRAELSDVFAVERELARVRTDIERMEAEARANADRVALATITVRADEAYVATLLPPSDSVGRRVVNAFIDGWRAAFDHVVGLVIGALEVAPTLSIWLFVLMVGYRVIRRRVRLGPRGSGLAA